MTAEISIQTGNKFLSSSTSITQDELPVGSRISEGCTNVNLPGITPLGIEEERLYLMYDQNPIFLGIGDIDVGDFNFLQANIVSVDLSLDGTIGTIDIEFPDKKFGDHLGIWNVPVKVAAGDPSGATDNIIFRGFLTDETGTLSVDTDKFTVKGLDYKWAISKLGKIRGRIYTTSVYTASTMPYDRSIDGTKIYTDRRYFERFRYEIGSANTRNGYLSSAETVFNPDGKPNCASADYRFNNTIFAEQALRARDNFGTTKYYYWNYAQIIRYIVQFWILPYTYVDKIEITGLSEIIDFPAELKAYVQGNNPGATIANSIDENYIRPANFNINDLNPLEALDKTVKAIPGDWHWDIVYHGDSIEIKIINLTKGLSKGQPKSLIIGTGEKLASEDNDVNVSDITVTRSIADRLSHAVAIGGPIKIETTIQLYPAWQQWVVIPRLANGVDQIAVGQSINYNFYIYDEANSTAYVGQTIGANQALSDFKSTADFNNWIKFIRGSENLVLSQDDKQRFESIYRVYSTSPRSLGRATRALNLLNPYFNIDLTTAITARDSNVFPSQLQRYYTGLINGDELGYMVAPFIDINRNINSPKTVINKTFSNSNNSVSGSDVTELNSVNTGEQPFIFMYDSLYSDTTFSQNVDLTDQARQNALEAKKWLIPEQYGISYSLSSDNTMVNFSEPQFARERFSARNLDDEKNPNLPEWVFEAESREVFMTCTIDTDVHTVVDYINETRVANYNNMNLVGFMFDESNETIIRVGAVFPVPTGDPGHQLSYSNGLIVRSNISDSNSALVDWNAYTGSTANTNNSKFVVENVNALLQTVIDMVDGGNEYKEDINVSLGKLDLSMRPGDRIKEVKNSELEDGTGGYYNLDIYIQGITLSKEGESDSYNVSLSLKNRDDFGSITNTVRST